MKKRLETAKQFADRKFGKQVKIKEKLLPTCKNCGATKPVGQSCGCQDNGGQ